MHERISGELGLGIAHHPIDADMKITSRKLYWELNYCIRRADKRSMCLGDIFISHGIREGLPSSSG